MQWIGVCRARVHAEDLGHRVHVKALPTGEVVVDDEVEGDEGPKGAPPHGEDGCPKGELEGEEGDDYEQHVVGEVAEEVDAR